MAERTHWWTARSLECRTIHLSIYPSIHPSIDDFAFLSTESTDLSVCQPIHLSVFPSICLAVYLSMQPSIHHPISVYSMCLSVYLSFYFSLSRSVHFLVSLSVCRLAVYPSIYLSAHPAIHSINLRTEAFHPSNYIEFCICPSRQFDSRQAGNISTDKTQSEQILGFSCGVTYKI